MTILLTIIIAVLAVLVGVLGTICWGVSAFSTKLSIENARLRSSEKRLSGELDRLLEENGRLCRFASENTERIAGLEAAGGILSYLAAEMTGDDARRDSEYHRLFFLGVPKDVLDDDGMARQFFVDCVDGRFHVTPGESPFKYSFTPRDGERAG